MIVNKKTLYEKFSDLLISPGKRALTGLILFLVGAIGLGIPVLIFLIPLELWGFLILISIVSDTRCYYDSKVYVPMPDGRQIPCTILAQKMYMYPPIIKFLSPYFYLPYRTRYILVKNFDCPEYDRKTQLCDTLIDIKFIDTDILSRSGSIEVITNPALLAPQLSREIPECREKYLSALKPYFDTGVLKEVRCTDRYSLGYMEDSYVLSLYGFNTAPLVMFVGDGITKKIDDPSCIPQIVIGMPELAENIALLSETVLYRYLKSEGRDDDAVQEVYARADAKKTPITHDLIRQRLSGAVTGRTVGGVLLLMLALGCLELSVAAIFLGFLGLTLTIPGLIVSLYFGIKNIKKGKLNKQNIANRRYRVVLAKCIRTDDQSDADGSSYTYYFSDGSSVLSTVSIFTTGDSAYLVYLKDYKKPNTFFKEADFCPAPDVTVEVS